MTLPSGTRLSDYEILELIGSGGMGEVYRAKDRKLGRDVAVKVLPEALRQDPQRLARFEREARVLASLNHPGIATLYGLERSDSVTFLVMELVPGETLEERLRSGPLSLEEAAALFAQIAEALEAAHAAGVVHRDLKPANIKVTPQGRIKVLDFGLAKAFAAEEPDTDLSHSPTLTRDATRAGVILGTASYMSPEQAKGRIVDKRTDIWAFGCVLFEALAGRKAFDGESATDVLANVIHKDVSWESLPADTTWRVRDVLRRCLTKDREKRFHDVADVRLELLDEVAPAMTTPGRSRPAVLSLLGAFVGGALLGWLVLSRDAPAPPSGIERFVITPPKLEPPLSIESPAISPDGRRIAYVGIQGDERKLYLRQIDKLDSHPVPGAENASWPFFSPDGMWVGFFGGDKLRKVSVLGGAPVDVTDGNKEGPGATWAPDGTIWFSGNWISGFYKIPAEGGKWVQATVPDPSRGEVGHWWPDFLPGGKTALFTIFTDRGTQLIAALDLESMTWKHLFPGMRARYVRSGHVVYYQAGIYQVVPFDPARVEVRGPPVPTLPDTRGLEPTGSLQVFFDVSASGIAVSVPGGAYLPRSKLSWIDPDGGIEELPFASAAIGDARLDPSGRRVAVSRLDVGLHGIWLYDLDSGTEERLTRDSNNFSPRWTPDGKRIVFTTARRGAFDVFVKPADALGPEELLVASDLDESAEALSPDGRWLAIVQFQIETSVDLALVRLDEPSDPIPVANTPFDESWPCFSRDSAWIAFRSTASGRSEVYVQRVPDGTGRVRVSSSGGGRPVFAPTKDELYYVWGDKVMAVRYTVAGGVFRPETPRPVLDLPRGHGASTVLDISPDGNRFLTLIDTGEDPTPTELHITTNWFEELNRIAPALR